MLGVRVGLILAVTGACFGFDVFHSESPTGSYRMNYGEAHAHCQSIGAHLATRQELELMRLANYSVCRCGWTLDKTAHFPMTYSEIGCGSRPGLHTCDWGYGNWDAYCFRGDQIGNCSRPLGMQNGEIHNSQIYASSEYHSWFPIFQNSKWSASIARLHNKDLVNAWIPKYNGRNQWLEVDLQKPTAVTGIVTQGASRFGVKMWVETFLIKYSKDGINYKSIAREFIGNVNNDGLRRNMFEETILARYIRYVPLKYHKRIALRLELLGCDMEAYELAHAGEQKKTLDIFENPFLEPVPDDGI